MRKNPFIILVKIASLLFAIMANANGQGAPIKIMPLGNSITLGVTDGTIPISQMKGWRYDLKQMLHLSGNEIDFVGSQSSGTDYFTDSQHAGIGGTRDQYVARLLTDGFDALNGVQILVPPGPYLDEYEPDIILLHIGTNDVTLETDPISIQKVSNILDLIDEYEVRSGKEITVILALIINRKKPWVAGSGADKTTAFNNFIKTMAQSRIANGDNLVIMDMENDAGFLYDDSDMADLVHPNATGYQKMALGWFGKLTEILPQNTYQPSIRIPPVSNGSVNTTYSSRVYAIGNPAPSYSLLSSPSGMSIDSQTGLITWIPASTGSFNISVVTSNLLGSDTLFYTLNITDVNFVGNTEVFSSSSGASNRRALPVSMTETGTISSISVYHNGGTGNALLAVYGTTNGLPNQRLAVTQPTPVNSTQGWQTVNLTTPVFVSEGTTVWLAWVFQNAVSLRFTSGAPGRAQSNQTWSSGMPDLFGTSSVSSSIYSIYATYSTSPGNPEPPAAPSNFEASAVSSTQINLSWTDNSNNETGFTLERSLISGGPYQVIHTTGADITSYSNTGLDPEVTYYYRLRAFNDDGNSAYTPEVQETTPPEGGGTSGTVGYTQIFASASGALNRRAQPVTMTENGTLNSISVYHSASSGNMILAVYGTLNGFPGQLMAITPVTAVVGTTGWQTVNLTTPVFVSEGTTIWLAWVFQNAVSLRFTSGAPGRAQSNQTWSAGMPDLFGTSSVSSSIYSIYATYSTSPGNPEPPATPSNFEASAVSSTQINLSWTDNSNNETGFTLERSLTSGGPYQVIHTTGADITSYNNTGLDPEVTYYYRLRAFNDDGNSAYTPEVQEATPPEGGGTSGTVGYTQIFASASGALNRRAQPVTMTENGTLNSISVYHSASSGNMILAVYGTLNGFPGQLMAITPVTAVAGTTGWQTVNLTTPVFVSEGTTIWLAWVFQNAVSLRFTSGTPGRAQSSQTWSAGMPDPFGTSAVSSSIYSVYANYISSSLKLTDDVIMQDKSKVNKPIIQDLSYTFDVYPTIVNSGFTIKLVLPDTRNISINVYNILGQTLKTIVNNKLDKGEHQFYIDDLSFLLGPSNSEVLFVRLIINNSVEVRKIIIVDK